MVKSCIYLTICWINCGIKGFIKSNQLVQTVLTICGAYFTARFTAITDTENENGEPTGAEITPKAIKKRC